MQVLISIDRGQCVYTVESRSVMAAIDSAMGQFLEAKRIDGKPAEPRYQQEEGRIARPSYNHPSAPLQISLKAPA